MVLVFDNFVHHESGKNEENLERNRFSETETGFISGFAGFGRFLQFIDETKTSSMKSCLKLETGSGNSFAGETRNLSLVVLCLLVPE